MHILYAVKPVITRKNAPVAVINKCAFLFECCFA
nr:MAG TPA: hypothetical protein [Caudoviricetes sp.]